MDLSKLHKHTVLYANAVFTDSSRHDSLVVPQCFGCERVSLVGSFGFGVERDHYLTIRMAGLHMTVPPFFLVLL
jgi:hypothetical protein